MSNMVKTTIVIPEDVLQALKIQAIQQKTTVSKILWENLSADKPSNAPWKKKGDKSFNKSLGVFSLGIKQPYKHREELYEDELNQKSESGIMSLGGKYKVKNPIPAEKIRDHIDYSDL